MLDTRDPERPSRTFSRCYVAPQLQVWLDNGGTAEDWLRGRIPLISYARISADRLRGDAIGVGRQHRNNTRSAEGLGCAVVLHYEDNNLTAAKETVLRPAFRRMCQDIIHGHERETRIPVRGCVSVERERVYRLRRDRVAFQDALVMAGDGVFVEGATMLDHLPVGGPTPGPAEVDRVRTRTARSRADRAEEGRVFAGPRRFGWLGASAEPYRLGNKHRDEREWPYLLVMIKERAAGKSWRGIAGDLNRRGARTARGGRWSEQGVKALVANPAWWGGRILSGALVTDPETGDPVIGEWDHADEAHDGVGYETWNGIMKEVRAARLHRGMSQGEGAHRPETAATARTYLFSGVLRCGRLNDLGEVCRSKLCGNKATGRNAKYGDYYRCGDPNCKGVGRRAGAVDAHLEDLVLDHLDEHFSGGTAEPVAWRGDKKLAALRGTRQGIEASLATGDAAWCRDVRDLLARVNRNIESLEAEWREHVELHAKENLLRGWSREKWRPLEVREKREVIARVLTSVLVLPVPEGVSDKAPFDPSLLIPSWHRETPARPSVP
ncbi:recombinase family protein [Streptomyces sp. SKN60]|uniref:recombinase family protein n=1 Tax=Streptomyces sp. SKN60 TaxID=2855506 RepID=UPI0022471226|nr:recombinase family protein [Streptomyces sp. SKN60]MCX2184332.1 recombinase family protein [Streptomyces sp. SKN60]